MSKSVLLVDDHAVFCEPIAAVLGAEGFEVHCAGHGAEALELLQTVKPDLILLDLIMPVMDGLTFLSRLREDPEFVHLPVMVLTAANDPYHRAEAERLGVREYMLKSRFSLVQMRQAVRRMFESISDDVASIDPLAALRRTPPLSERGKLLGELETFSRIKALSPTTEHVLSLTCDPDSDIDALVAAINLDAALAVRLLKLANSVVYRRGEPVETVRQAVVRLGMGNIRYIALTVDVITRLTINGLGRWLDRRLLWEHALAVGLIAEQIARSVGLTRDRAETLFTAGLLHDLGRLMLAEHMPKVYAQVIEQAHTLRLPLEQVEHHRLGLHHAEVAAVVLTHWRLPRSLIDPIAHHHDSVDQIDRLDPPDRMPAAIIALADRLAHAWLIGASGNDMIMPIGPLARLVGLTEDDVPRIGEQVRPLIDHLKVELIEIEPGAAWPNERTQRIGQLARDARPLIITEDGRFDAYGQLAAALHRAAGSSSDLPPNFALVHQSLGADRADLARRLTQAEARLNLSPLPTLLISPRPDDTLDCPADERRTVHHLLSPTHTNTFIEALRRAIDESGQADDLASTG